MGFFIHDGLIHKDLDIIFNCGDQYWPRGLGGHSEEEPAHESGGLRVLGCSYPTLNPGDD